MTVEGEVVKSLLAYLEARGHTTWRNNSGAIRRRGRMVRFGKVGSPDLIGHTRNGAAIYVEAKRHGGKRSPEQVEFADKAIACHCIYVLAESVDDLIEAGL